MTKKPVETEDVQTPAGAEQPAVEQPTAADSTARRTATWEPAKLFWGGLLVITGVLLLLNNLDILTVKLENLWLLWPLVIVGIGVSFFTSRSPLGRAVTLLLIVASFALAVYVVTQHNTDTDSEHTQSVSTRTESGVSTVNANLETGGASITLDTHTGRQAVEASLSSSVSKLTSTSVREGDTQRVQLSTDALRPFAFGPVRNDLQASFTRDTPLELTIDSGAVKLRGDLRGAQLRTLAIDTGASSVDLTLGSRMPTTDITIDAGASSVTLHVPKSSGVRIESDSGLTKFDLEDIEKRSDTSYESDAFGSAKHKITIKADLGASKFRIVRY